MFAKITLSNDKEYIVDKLEKIIVSNPKEKIYEITDFSKFLFYPETSVTFSFQGQNTLVVSSKNVLTVEFGD